MKRYYLIVLSLFFASSLFGQVGHVMQGVGSTNMTMGGAATAQPLDINGPLHWNPAGISVFDENELSINFGLFFSAPELSSTVPTPEGPFSGVTEDDRPTSILPSLAMVFGKEESKHTFGISAFGISGFGVTFPENMMNPINMPQSMGGFGNVESDYMLLQVGLTYAYELSDNLSIGVAPTFNYAALEIAPNPLAVPSMTLGYPTSDKSGALGFGAQGGIFYQADNGFKLGASYKSAQFFSDLELESAYLDESEAPTVMFNLDYPAIYSVGAGYSNDIVDVAVDYRLIDYENTDGFEASGWQIASSGQFAGFPTGAVNGFGWENVNVISAGIQFNGIDKLPVRAGYTYSSNPINEDLAFFSIPATAIIKNAFQFGVGYEASETISINTGYHHGTSSGATTGMLLNPMLIAETNLLGAVPGSEVSYDMTTDMIMLGVDIKFPK